MKRLFPSSSQSNLRVFIACLLSFMTLIAPIASVAASTRSGERLSSSSAGTKSKSELTPEERLEASLFKAPVAAAPAATPDITAVKTASFADSDGDTKAELGETITYNVNVANGGPVDATNVTFADTIDPNTTLVPGSLKVSPLAFADSYVTTKNTTLNVGAPGVLGNDTGTPAPTVNKLNGTATLTGTTTQGGTITIFADGHFDYTPANNFEGADTFTYTVTNGQAPDDTATVTINVDAPPSVTATTPVNGAANATTGTAITVTFSESVSATSNAFKIECPTGTPITFTQSASPATVFTLTPSAALPTGVTCTVTVDKDEITDTDAFDPPDNMVGDYTFSFSTDAAPTVTTTVPTNGASPVAANTNITVNFSEPVTANTSAFTIECPVGTGKTFTLSGSGTSTLTLDPTADLPFGTLCTVTVIAAQIHDQDSNDPPDTMANNVAFSFTIDSPPSVSSTVPVNNATGVPTNAAITVNFSESVNATTSSFVLKCPSGGAARPYTLSSSPSASFTLTPSAPLPEGVTCQVTVVAAQITDQDSVDPPDQMLAPDYVFSFTTDIGPSVTGTVPTNNATQVSTTTPITITFSEPVDVTGSWYTISCATSGAHTATVTGGPTTFTLTPDTPFTEGEVCTVTISNTLVTDQDNNDPPDTLSAPYVFSFTIDTPPSVTATTPINNAAGVLVGTNIDITFNEPVDATTSSFTIECPTGSGNQAYALSNNGAKTIYTLNPSANLPAGAVCTVTVLAAQISDTDAGDPPDHLTSNYVFSFKIPPVANADTYPQTVIGNVNVNSASIPYSITSNDTFAALDPITITKVQAVTTVIGNTITATTTKGGTVVVTVSGADIGKFQYNPPAGYEGIGVNGDTFTYEITNNGGTSPAATVTLPINGMVWFINNGAPSCTTIAAGCGRITNPFSDLSSFNAENGNSDVPGSNLYYPAANDNIFIYQSGTAYNSNITLENGQKIFGQDSTTALATLTGLTPPSGSASFPTMLPADGTITKITTTAAATNGIVLAQNNTINGLTVGSTTGAAILGSSFGTLNVADVNINDTGSRTGQALFLATGALNAVFGNVSSSSSATTNVTLTSVTGSINLGTGTLSGSTGNAFSVSGSGNTANISYAGTITNTSARAVNIVNKTGGTVAFTGAITSSGSGSGVFLDVNTGTTMNFSGGLNLTTGSNAAFTATGGGTVNICDKNPCGSATSVVNTITTTTGTGLNVANTTIGTSGLTFQKISVTGNNTLPASGIILNNTGTNAGLKVTANGGSCTPATPTCTGGEIQGTGSHGISLTSTQSVELNLISIHNTGDNGINGNGVNGFILRDSRIYNFGNGVSAGGATEDGMNMTNLSGTATIQRDNIGPDGHFTLTPFPTAPENDGITVRNTNVAPLVMNVTGTKFLQISNDGIDAEVNGGTATLTGTLNVDGSTGDGINTFDQINGRAVVFSAPLDNASLRTLELTIKNNTFNLVGIGGRWFAPARTTMNARFNNNTMTSTTNDSIRSESDPTIPSGLPLSSRAIVNATVSNNNLGGGSIFISNHREAIQSISFLNNTNIGGTAAGVGGAGSVGVHTGINLRSDRGSTLNVDMVGNTATADGSLAQAQSAVYAQVTNNGGGNSTICLNIKTNNLTENPDTAGQAAVVLDTGGGGGGTIALEGWNGVGGATGAQNYVIANNTITATAKALADSPGVIAGGDCVTVLLVRNNNQRSFPAQVNSGAQTELAKAASTVKTIVPGLELLTAHNSTATKVAAQKAAQRVALRSNASEKVKTAQAQTKAEAQAARTENLTFTGHAVAKAKAQPAANSFLNRAAAAPSGETVNATIGTLPSGKSVTISFQVTVNTAASFTGTSPQVSNQGTVQADNPNGGTLSIQTDDVAGGAISPTITPVDSQPDLEIVKTDGGGAAVPGGTVSYTLAYNNTNGKRDANNTVITETIPANTTFNAGASDPSWSCPGGITAGNTCTLAVGNIPAGGAGASAVFAVTVVNPLPAGVTGLSNTATIADDGLFGVDGNTTNNSSTALTSITAAINLTISKSDGDTGATVGQNVSYTLTYANAGNKGATGVVINETVPANTTFNAGASTAGWVCTPNNNAGSTCKLTIGALAGGGAGGSVTFAVTVDNPVPGGTTQISNTATINDDGANGADADTSNNTGSDTTPFDAPPAIGTYSATSLFVTEGTTVSPTAAPTDDKPGFTVGVAAPGFTGGLSVNQTTGVVTITNAGPASASPYTVTVTVTDSIGQTAIRTFDLTVSKSNTTTTLSSSHPTLYVNQTVTYTATVASTTTVTGPPTGTVDFFDGGTPIATCTGVAVDGSGKATCQQTYANTVGSPHSITAVYSGDSAFNTSTASALSQTVNPALSVTVNTTGDQADANIGDGICDVDTGTVGSQCTLRAAIQETNSIPSPDTIGFSLPASSIITLSTALDAINGSLNIAGPGAGTLTVKRSTAGGTPNFNIFNITGGNNVTISGMTITNANSPAGIGGGIFNLNSTLTVSDAVITGNHTDSSGRGGGIANISTGANNASLTVTRTTVSGNSAVGFYGGGIYNQTDGGGGNASANIIESTISGNNSLLGGGIGSVNTAGSTATLTIVNSTISGNGSTDAGGGVATIDTTTSMTNVTITNNTADTDNNSAVSSIGGGLYVQNGTVTLNNTIVAGNFDENGATDAADDISGALDAASSYNLIGDGTGMTGITHGSNGNQVGSVGTPIDARLGPLANNGGPTQTHALLPGSPALDAGSDTAATNASLATDQRGAGFNRFADSDDAGTTATVDIGAFEAQVALSNIADQATNEDAVNFQVNFNVSDGVTSADVTATSSDTSIVPNPVVSGAGSPLTLTINPVANKFGAVTITVTVTKSGFTMVDTFVLTVNAVADQPSVTNGSTNEDTMTPAGQLVISRNAVDGTEVSYFQITGITNGTLFQNNGTTPIVNGDFITYAQGNAGLRFLPAPNSVANGSFTVQGSIGNVIASGPTATATITVTGVNDQPTLDAITPNPLNILEDAGAQNVSLTGITDGGGEGQTLVVTASSNNTGLIPNPTVTYTSPNATGSISFTPVANASGTADITVTVNDNGGGTQTVSRTFTVNVANVNDAPSFTKGADQTVNEDAGAQTVNPWASAISQGTGDTGQTVSFQVTGNTNSGLFAVQPSVSPAGVLTYTPAANTNGTAAITLVIKDNGGTANGGVDTSAPQTFNITVSNVNDAPSFTKGADQTVNEDAGAQTVNPWATALSAGPADESGQTLAFTVTNNNNALFSAQPSVSPTGVLTFTTATNAVGTATVSVTLKDNGGTAGGGQDTSATQTFQITVNGVNDAPSFTKGANQSVGEDAGAQSVPNWATAISAGPADESGQTVTFTATNDNNALFSVQPSISPTGTLTYTPATNAGGVATVSVSLKDNGGTANGGVDTSAVQTFTITVVAANDAPVNTVPGAQSVVKNGALTFSAANSNLISIADIDAGAGTMQVTLTATNGRVTLSGTTGLAFTVGDGTSDTTMTFTGTIANVNNALNGLSFAPTNGYDGPATLQITTNDQGNTGTGGAQSDTDTINIDVLKGGVLQFSAATYTVSEGGGTATITVSRTDGSVGTSHIDYATSNGTATAGSDYTAASGTLTFDPGVTSQTFTVPITNDALDEADETVNLTLSNITGSSSLGAQTTAVLTITDDDASPSLSINDVTVTEGNSGTVNATFTVTLSAVSGLPVSVNYATSNGTATAPSDYTAIASTALNFAAGETTKSVTVVVKGDTDAEPDENFFVNLSGATNASISDNQGTGTIVSDDTPVIQFSASAYSVSESGLRIFVTVNRLGDVSKAARVDYATSDPSALTPCSTVTGNASSRCDYATSVGTLRFAAGETSKIISIPIVNDVYLEGGSEVFTITLSNPVGAELGTPTTATVTINDADLGSEPNPIDNDEFFIRQLYIDFLGREAEPQGLAAWLGILNHCAIPSDCDRIAVAQGFVRSAEFRDRGYFVYRFFEASLGRVPLYSEFIPDMAKVSGFLSDTDLEANKEAYIQEFINRPEFKNRYDSTLNNPTAYVDKLLSTATLPNHPRRAEWIAALTNNTLTRAQVLRQFIESTEVFSKYYNEAFIVMNYFGFLRRNPDAAYLAWIDIFNHTNDDRGIINGFVNSGEYRARFGP